MCTCTLWALHRERGWQKVIGSRCRWRNHDARWWVHELSRRREGRAHHANWRLGEGVESPINAPAMTLQINFAVPAAVHMCVCLSTHLSWICKKRRRRHSHFYRLPLCTTWSSSYTGIYGRIRKSTDNLHAVT